MLIYVDVNMMRTETIIDVRMMFVLIKQFHWIALHFSSIDEFYYGGENLISICRLRCERFDVWNSVEGGEKVVVVGSSKSG